MAKNKDTMTRLVGKVCASWKPVLKGNHRAHVLSAGLLVENSDRPWAEWSSYGKRSDEFSAELQFLETCALRPV